MHAGGQSLEASALYVVATPIGNLRDISLRALDVLRGVDAIAAEDTRVSRTLLEHYAINTRMFAVHEHNERAGAERIADLLREGKTVALITDAGTPAVSDPGAVLVAAIREAGFKVVPIPGASALISAVSAAGMKATSFTFVGFLPVKSGQRKTQLLPYLHSTAALVCYESPHRIVECLEDMVAVFGEERRVVVCREITKRFETIVAGGAAQMLTFVRDEANQQRGEFVLIVEGVATAPDTDAAEAERVLKILCAELPTKQAAALAANLTGIKKNVLYDMALKIREQNTADGNV